MRHFDLFTHAECYSGKTADCAVLLRKECYIRVQIFSENILTSRPSNWLEVERPSVNLWFCYASLSHVQIHFGRGGGSFRGVWYKNVWISVIRKCIVFLYNFKISNHIPVFISLANTYSLVASGILFCKYKLDFIEFDFVQTV